MSCILSTSSYHQELHSQQAGRWPPSGSLRLMEIDTHTPTMTLKWVKEQAWSIKLQPRRVPQRATVHLSGKMSFAHCSSLFLI